MTATHLRRFYVLADRKYGNIIDKFKQDVPRNLILAHVGFFNRNLLNAPAIKNYHRGFMYVSIAACRRANVDWDKLKDPTTCAYAWCTDANRASYLFFSNNTTLFPTSNEDFWKCLYLKLTLEDPAFNALWSIAQPVAGHIDGVYGQLKAAVASLRGSLPGWPIPELRKRVLLDLETVFSLAKLYGPLSSTSPGRPPYMSGDDANRVFVE